MRVEVPQFKKCCFCVPLRYGLLVWGYIKLLACLFSLFIFLLLCCLIHPHDSIAITIMTLVALAWTLDTSFSIVFVIGAHKKSTKLLRIFYIAAIVAVVIVSLVYSVFFINQIIFLLQYGNTDNVNTGFIRSMYRNLLFEAALACVNIGMQCYMILLVRSEVIKLKANCQFEFVNNATESECRMNIQDI